MGERWVMGLREESPGGGCPCLEGRRQGHRGSAHQTGSLSFSGVVEEENAGCVGSSGHAACPEPLLTEFQCGVTDFPGGPVVKNRPCSSGDTGSIPAWSGK